MIVIFFKRSTENFNLGVCQDETKIIFDGLGRQITPYTTVTSRYHCKNWISRKDAENGPVFANADVTNEANEKTTLIQLLDCPFCGVNGIRYKDEENKAFPYITRCANQDCIGHHDTWEESQEEADTAWNIWVI